ncbi:MAG: hypothetical protein ABIN97_12620 [Ginsengibacter sp.]
MIKKLLLSAGLMLYFFATDAQNCLPDPSFWADYNGWLGDKEIQLSVYKSADGNLIGNYRFINDEKKVFVFTGSEKNCTYSLDVVDNKNEAVGKFMFQYSFNKVTKKDIYEGVYTDNGNKRSSLRLQLSTMVGGSPTQRYFELFGTTQEVEAFAEKIKASFIDNDKNWLAEKCQYPLIVYFEKGKKRIINSDKQFLDNYDKLFSKAFLEKFKKIKCYNMFSSHIGAAMNKGEVVINHTKNSTSDKYEYCISSITVFLW